MLQRRGNSNFGPLAFFHLGILQFNGGWDCAIYGGDGVLFKTVAILQKNMARQKIIRKYLVL
jgi:hypothetical protein